MQPHVGGARIRHPLLPALSGHSELTAGAALGVKGQLDRESLQGSCAPRCDKATQVDPIADEWLAAAVTAVAGAVLAGSAVAVWFVEARTGRAPAPVTHVTLVPGPGWVSVTGRF